MPAKDVNNKTWIQEIPQRFEIKRNKTEGILNYDLDNAYPQRVKLLSDSSVMATTCIKLYRKFIKGRGWEDEVFGKTVLNPNGQTFNEMLGITTNDFAQWAGFAIHFNYNALLEIDSMTYVPFDYCRLTLPDSEHAEQIAIYNDWGRLMSRSIRKENIAYVDKYNSDKEAIKAQIEQAGGFEKWNGQIFWYSSNQDSYPLPIYDDALPDVETDSEIALFKNSNVKTNFLAAQMLLIKQEFETQEEREEYMAGLMEFQGGRNSNRLMMIDGVTDDNVPELLKVDVANNDTLYQYHESSVQDNIRRAFLAPKELVGQEYSTGFETDRIQQAREYYNEITEEERLEIGKQYEKFVPNFKTNVNVNNNYNIKPLYARQADSSPE